MDNLNTTAYDVYRDISERTNGEIYLGVVGPVRTGKSTFIKRFMDVLALPGMEDAHSRERAIDELPQAAQGKTIMTTEPKFVPRDAVRVKLTEDVEVSLRLIDCVGFMVEGASGHLEEGAERMVKTPWFDYEIPFTQAAEIGTRRVITEHATIGIVITADGSFTELPRESYVAAEERTVQELRKLGKPFVMLLNAPKPYSEETAHLAEELQEKYKVSVVPVNCEQLRREDILHILESVLYEFPIARVDFYLPKWVEMLDGGHAIKASVIENAKRVLDGISYARDVKQMDFTPTGEYLKRMKPEKVELATGRLAVYMDLDESYYYANMSELAGVPISGEYQLISMVKELAQMKQEYGKVASAMEAVRQKGYGVVTPQLGDIEVEEPELIRHGSKFGVKIKAKSPSIHIERHKRKFEFCEIIYI